MPRTVATTRTKRKTSKHNGHTAIGDGIRHAGHKIDEFSENMGERGDQFIHRGQEFAEQVKEGASEYTEVVTDYIQSNPVKSTLIACGVGVLVGILLRKRH